ENPTISDEELETRIASYKLENSYIGIMGKAIEPVIRPLGYDWKIGIAVLTSFAAREVFVGTLATIYSVGDVENDDTIKGKMEQDADRKPAKRYLILHREYRCCYFMPSRCNAQVRLQSRKKKRIRGNGHWHNLFS